MLRIAVFGVTCEIDDGDFIPVMRDHLRLTRQEAQAAIEAGASFTEEVRDYFEAEAEECCPITPEWVVERLQRLYGVEIDPASVDAALRLPLQVEFGPRLLEQLPK